MSKRKPMDKAQARERRNQLLESAASAKLSLTEGVREMRAISGMTQEEFAQHRGVSARVIKAIELGQGNPTVATLNRIGAFFGLEVAFVPVGRHLAGTDAGESLPCLPADVNAAIARAQEDATRQIYERLDAIVKEAQSRFQALMEGTVSDNDVKNKSLAPKKRKTRSS